MSKTELCSGKAKARIEKQEFRLLGKQAAVYGFLS